MSRPWKDYDDSLDYDELKKREQARLEYIEAKRRADDAAIDARKHKAMKITGALVAVFFTAAVVFAFTQLKDSDSFRIPNRRGHTFSVDLSGAVEGIEVLPDSEQTVVPVMTNTGTEPMYVFIRFDTSTYTSSEDGQEKSVYSFTPDEDGLWTQIEGDNPGQLIYAYGTDTEMTVVSSKESVSLPGTLKVTVDASDFVDLTDDDMEVKVTGCAVGTDVDSKRAYDAYQEYISAGGE